MIGNPTDKRRCERFAELMDAAHSGPRSHRRTSHDDELTSLVDVGKALGETGEQLRERSRPRERFQTELRAQLVAVAEAQQLGPRHEATRQPVRPLAPGRRRAVVAGALAAGVLGLSGVSTASGGALPGDTLYPVKRSTERAQLAMVSSEVNRGQLFFEFARTRLHEAAQVASDASALRAAMEDMDDQIVHGVRAMTTAAVGRQDPAPLDGVDDFLTSHIAELERLRTDVVSVSAVDESLGLLDEAAERSHSLRESLPCGADADARSDRLGPLPAECRLPGGGGQEESSEPHATRDGQQPSAEPSASDAPTGGNSAPESEPSAQPSSTSTPPDDDGGGILGQLDDLL